MRTDLARAVEEFGDHLEHERGRPAHTVRAYLTDLRGLVEHLQEQGVDLIEYGHQLQFRFGDSAATSKV